MRAGERNQSIAVDEPVTDQSASGAETVVWTEREIVRASVLPLTGNERLRAGGIAAEADVRIVMGWMPTLDAMTAKWRLRHLDKGGTTTDGKPGTPYNITSPPSNVAMANRDIEVMANAGLNQG